MIYAGNCLLVTEDDAPFVIENARALKDIGVDFFRCKIYGGGTSPDKYFLGIWDEGITTLEYIDFNILPCGTEVHTPKQMEKCNKLTYLWIGARNSRNYSFLKEFSEFEGYKLVKRAPDQTVDEVIGIYDICLQYNGYAPAMVERGISTFDRLPDSRWSPDLKGVIRIKVERPDIFDTLIVDCSHSVFRKELVRDTYQAFKSIGVKNFMFECTIDGKSKTDQRLMLSVDELNKVIHD